MDIKLEKKPWYIRYRYSLIGGIVLLAGLIYVIVLAAGPRRLRIKLENVQTAEVRHADFLEYVDVEGIVQPIMTIIVNTREEGNVHRIVAEEGRLMKQGDTILVLTNPNLMRDIEDQQDEWEKQRISYREKELEMEQKSLTLKQQTLEAEYELNKIRKSYEREYKKMERSQNRVEELVVRAPVDGQLSFVKVTPGQKVGAGENIAEVKVMDQFKIHTSLSEYYIDRVTTGLPATISYQNRKYPLKVTKVVPEVKDRMFEVDLVFTDSLPENVRLGKSFRVQIELGQPEKALVVSRGNFYQQTGGNWIYKLNADKTRAVKVPITIGRQNPVQYEITEGLQPGDWVITTGYDNFGDAEELVL